MRIAYLIINLQSNEYYTGGGTVVTFTRTIEIEDFTSNVRSAKEYETIEEAELGLTEIGYPFISEIKKVYIND